MEKTFGDKCFLFCRWFDNIYFMGDGMNVLSYYDGISCGRIALERAGVKVNTYYASEIDNHAVKVSKSNYPDIVQLGDVTKWREWDLPGIDLLIGGSPCQSFSPAISSNTGFDGKSSLFFEFADTLKSLQACNPDVKFLLENVEMKSEWRQVITDFLRVEPVAINSDIFSAQSRPRLYWTNIPIQEITIKCPLVLGDVLDENVDEKYFYNKAFEFHGENKVVAATLDIKGHDILKRVNSKKHKCQCLTAVCGGNQQKKVIDPKVNKVRKLTPSEYERLQTVPHGYTDSVCDGARYKLLGNGWTVDVIAHIFKGLK